MKMKASQAIVQILEKEGVTDAFGIPGAGINGLYQFMAQSSIRHYTHRHEECCVHAAGGYYRASGKIAVALCTSGPGATNFVTGIYTCQIDSIPVVAITGQAVRAQLGKDAFQCVDIAKICEPVAKKTYCLTDTAKVAETFREAFRVAREGKPGPVVIDLPLEVQNTDIEFDIDNYTPASLTTRPQSRGHRPRLGPDQKRQTPLLLMGGGVLLADAVGECVRLAELMKLPIITTILAKGCIPEEPP
jgi:tartronate-semialdehyde synthase